MGPHAQDVHDAFLGEDLVDEAVLDVDPSGVAAGEVANEMLLITKGKISVVGRMEDGSVHRFATLAPGMILGEIAMISNRPPLGSFRVDTDVAAYSLGREDLSALQESNPQLTCKLLENLIKAFAVRLTQLSREISR